MSLKEAINEIRATNPLSYKNYLSIMYNNKNKTNKYTIKTSNIEYLICLVLDQFYYRDLYLIPYVLYNRAIIIQSLFN